MDREARTRFRQELRRKAMNYAGDAGLEWADDRVRNAILEENGSSATAYMVVVQRAIRARILAVLKEGRKTA